MHTYSIRATGPLAAGCDRLRNVEHVFLEEMVIPVEDDIYRRGFQRGRSIGHGGNRGCGGGTVFCENRRRVPAAVDWRRTHWNEGNARIRALAA